MFMLYLGCRLSHSHKHTSGLGHCTSEDLCVTHTTHDTHLTLRSASQTNACVCGIFSLQMLIPYSPA